MKKDNFFKNVFVLLLSQGIVKTVGIIYKLYLTNKTGYGDVGNALFAANFQVYIIFLTVCSIGIPNAISSLVSEKFAIGDAKGAYRILKIAVTIFGTLGFMSSYILYNFAGIITKIYLQIPETENILKILAPSVFAVGIASVLKGYFNGKQKMKITANALSIEQIIRTICTIIIVEILSFVSKNNTNIMACGVGFSVTIGEIISLLYIYINYLKSKKEIWTDIVTSKMFKEESKKNIIKKILKVSIPIAMCALIGTLNKTIDAITVVRISKGYLGELEAIRQYGILSGKIESLILFPLSFNIALTTTLLPTISGMRAKGQEEKAKEVFKLSILAGIIAGIFCFTFCFVYAKNILETLFPNASDGSNMLKYSAIITMIAIINQTINSYMLGIKKMGIQFFSISIGCIIKLVLNILLIKNEQIGIYGAVISNIVSYTLTLVILVSYLIKKEKIHFETNMYFIKPFILTMLMFILLNKLNSINICSSKILNLAINIIIAVVCYALMIIMLYLVSKKDLKIAPFGRHKTVKRLKINKNLNFYNKKEGFCSILTNYLIGKEFLPIFYKSFRR